MSTCTLKQLHLVFSFCAQAMHRIVLLHALYHNVRVDISSGQPGSHSLLAHIIILYGLCPFMKCEPKCKYLSSFNHTKCSSFFLECFICIKMSIYDAQVVMHRWTQVKNMFSKIRRKVSGIQKVAIQFEKIWRFTRRRRRRKRSHGQNGLKLFNVRKVTNFYIVMKNVLKLCAKRK